VVYRLCSLDAHNGHQTPCALMSAPKLSAGVAYWLGIGSPVRSTEFDSPHPLHAGVAQVEEHRTRNAEVGVSNTPSGSSRCSSMGEQSHGRRPMSVRFAPLAPKSRPCKHRWRCAGPVLRKSRFESGTGLHLSMRASEPVSCWPHKPCEWRSTRQPATIFINSRFINSRCFSILNSGGEDRSWQHST
jgi:hypothetical protein